VKLLMSSTVELTQVAEFYKLNIASSTKKAEIYQLLIKYLLEEELISAEEEPSESAKPLCQLELEARARERKAETESKVIAAKRKGVGSTTKAKGAILNSMH